MRNAADDGLMDAASPTGSAWRGRLGAILSLTAVGLALAALVRTSAGTCVSRPGGATSLDLTPLVFFGVTSIALLFDLRAIRRGGAGARWGRVGLVAISAAAVLGIWTAGATLLGLNGCG